MAYTKDLIKKEKSSMDIADAVETLRFATQANEIVAAVNTLETMADKCDIDCRGSAGTSKVRTAFC